ncbi:MAG: branched-chain amino acid ABC transporter permease [Mesorhizobium sp.]
MSELSRRNLTWLCLLAIVFVVAPAFLAYFDQGYFYQLSTLALIFALLAASLHLVTGVSGLLHLGQAAFYGVGAYVAALLSINYEVPFSVGLPLAGLGAAAVAVLVALPTMRLVSIYFAVATLAIGQMIYLVLLNWVGLTEGPNGLVLSSGIEFFGYDVGARIGTYFVVAVIVLFSLWVIHRLTHSYYGNALRALREDDQCADAMGIDTVRLKVGIFAVSAFFAGIAGALWAYTTGYISPGDFNFANSILILAMVVVGGLGSLPGAVIGALLLILLPEALRGVGDFRNIMVGLTMFLVIVFVPKGLMGEVSALAFFRSRFASAWQGGGGGKVGWR